MVGDKFRELRVNLRNSARKIVVNILDNHFDPANNANLPDLCIFCGSSERITREHVIPRWVFGSDPSMFFVTTSNEQSQTFIRSIVPACVKCNATCLSSIERYIQGILSRDDLDRSATYEELVDLLRWMEIIEYKFHVLEFRRKYRASKSRGYDPILSNVPLSVWRRSIGYSPYKAVAQLRKAQTEVTIKGKESKFHSLVIFGLTDPKPHFIHSMGSYLYFSLPQYKKALFYFIDRELDDYSAAAEEARRIIIHAYKHWATA
jgi:hypothetical protein